jgi:uncharacterized Zn-binding protein involved in type VI secretion
MGLPVTRLNDMSTGHDCHAPQNSLTASVNVFINKRGVHRQGDLWAVHCCDGCHPGALAVGSSSVNVNSLAVGRIGDQINCGSVVMTGSANVFAGG